MESFSNWSERAEGWLERDLALLTDDAGWREVVRKDDLVVWRRPMRDDPNHLFRWKLGAVDATAEIVFEGFVHRVLEHHARWTREYTGGRVIEAPRADARVLYQRFQPGVPGISARDLCSIEVVRDLAPGVKLASFRSVDLCPPEPGFERIDWWGAALSRTLDDGARSELVYLDRENQGGRFPSWLMNLVMPRYLVLQAREVRRFFANGGPPSLREPRPT